MQLTITDITIDIRAEVPKKILGIRAIRMACRCQNPLDITSIWELPPFFTNVLSSNSSSERFLSSELRFPEGSELSF
jgi:hypothetical protein